ncbi:MAG: hypothetical protein E2O73_00745 [Deltaproteobacteria bacterium]|nr:MAG: hypothetical protein E2O73_00745 [Deltaproteobacteria bacterium]
MTAAQRLRVARSLRQHGVEKLTVQLNPQDRPTIWIVCEQRVLCETLAAQLRTLGPVRTGPPERAHWREQELPDLLVVAAPATVPGDLAGLERLLGFMRTLPQPARGPLPALYVEGAAGLPPAALASSLIDDRPVRSIGWPLEREQLLAEAEALLAAPQRPLSLRERARSEWVTRRVELLYADLELPALRHAIDPRNAARPVLLLGEGGTGKGLLARYIQNLAEPAREQLLLIAAPSLEPGRIEAGLLKLCAARRVSVYLSGLDRASRAVQEELAQLLGQSGWLGVESLRWIASASGVRRMTSGLLALPWLRVELPALRERPDLEPLARKLTQAWARQAKREVELADDTLALLHEYAWPGNLQELESVLERSLAASAGAVLGAADVRIAPEPGAIATPATPATAAASAQRNADVPAPTESLAASARTPAAAAVPAQALEPLDPALNPGLSELVPPLAQEFRQPLLAIRTYTSLLDQRPDDASVRRKLGALVEGDLVQLDELLSRLERFIRFEPPRLEPLDLASLVAAELEKRQATTRARSLVVLRELDHAAPPVLADAEQIRFALGALLDRAFRMVPAGGDLYIGSLHHPAEGELPARNRLLIRFHSPEEVLVAPDDLQGPRIPLDVLMARALVLRMQGTFAIDSSGAQDNVILIELHC